MTGFWSTETLNARLPAEGLVVPYDPELVQNCAYELRLGSEVYVTGEDSQTKRNIDDGEQIRIPPGQFANLLTEETVRIPADALGLLSARFKWKQRGLVNVSGFHIDPGYEGKLLFSVFNAGPTPVVVARGDPLFLLWYCSLDRQTDDLYSGQPRNTISSQDVSHLQGEVASPQALAIRVATLERFVRGAKWVAISIAGATIAALIGLGIRSALDDGTNTTPSSTTTTVQPQATTTTVQAQATTTVP